MLVETIPDLVELVEPLLVVGRALREQIVILHRIWVDGTEFCWTREAVPYPSELSRGQWTTDFTA